ncbi:MAG: PQQ-binding-like beta-propeller repeat protein, partial [Planctomycetota bacterium]|nr:PQQ-binding-like beta-propeller repeat protein [Planctomycetota bacterium]
MKPPLKLLWVFTSDGTIESSPAVAEGVVYIGSCDGNLYALDAESGRLKWKFKAGGAIVSSPTVDAKTGVVYFGCNDFKLYGIRSHDGKLLWQHATAPAAYAHTHGDQVKASPALKDGTIFIGNYKGKWLAIQPKIGSGAPAQQVKTEPLWTAKGKLTFASPAVNGQSVVFADLDRIACLDAGTGKLKWERKGLGAFLATPVIRGKTVYAATAGKIEWQSRRFTNGSLPNADRFARTSGSVLALNLATGHTRWKSATRDRVIASPAVSRDQVIVATVLGQVAGLDRTSGRHVWEASASSIEDGIWASPAVTGDSVAVTSTDGWLYLFNTQSHKLTWAFDTRSPIYASPAIANGTIFIANTSGHVMAFGQGNAISTELAPREPRDLDWAVSFPVQNSFWSLVGTVESFKSQPMKTWLKTGPRSRYRRDRGDLLDFLFTLKVERGGGKRYDLGTGKPVKINTSDVVSACSRPPTTYNQLHLSPTQVGPPAEMKNRRRVRLVCALENPLNPLIPKGKRPFSAYLIQVQPLKDDITPPEHWPVWYYNNWIHFTTEIEEKGHAQALGGLGLEFVGWGTSDERVHARYFPGP